MLIIIIIITLTVISWEIDFRRIHVTWHKLHHPHHVDIRNNYIFKYNKFGFHKRLTVSTVLLIKNILGKIKNNIDHLLSATINTHIKLKIKQIYLQVLKIIAVLKNF